MATYSRMGALPQILLLLFTILFLVAGGAVWFSVLGVIDLQWAISPVLNLLGIESSVAEVAVEDPLLLDTLRIAKMNEALELREQAVLVRESELAAATTEFAARLAELERREQLQTDRENSFNERVSRYDNRRANLVQIARDLTSMRPDDAVAILIGYEDQLLIDILRITEELAQEAGELSLVSVWLARMPRDRVAELQRKMTLRPAN